MNVFMIVCGILLIGAIIWVESKTDRRPPHQNDDFIYDYDCDCHDYSCDWD